MKLLEINSEKFNVDIDLRYATDNNFTGNKVYNYIIKIIKSIN